MTKWNGIRMMDKPAIKQLEQFAPCFDGLLAGYLLAVLHHSKGPSACRTVGQRNKCRPSGIAVFLTARYAWNARRVVAADDRSELASAHRRNLLQKFVAIGDGCGFGLFRITISSDPELFVEVLTATCDGYRPTQQLSAFVPGGSVRRSSEVSEQPCKRMEAESVGCSQNFLSSISQTDLPLAAAVMFKSLHDFEHMKFNVIFSLKSIGNSPLMVISVFSPDLKTSISKPQPPSFSL